MTRMMRWTRTRARRSRFTGQLRRLSPSSLTHLNRKLGIWELCATGWLRIGGTTPTNADIWTLHVDLGTAASRPGIWLRTGPHWGILVWLGGERHLQIHRRPRVCRCWGCTGARLTRVRRRQKPGWDTSVDLRKRPRKTPRKTMATEKMETNE